MKQQTNKNIETFVEKIKLAEKYDRSVTAVHNIYLKEMQGVKDSPNGFYQKTFDRTMEKLDLYIRTGVYEK